MIVQEPIRFANQNLILTNLRAIYWPKERSIILSDSHFGKPKHFRQQGIPIPDQVAISDLKRLEYLVEAFSALQVIVVGDMFHSNAPNIERLFYSWRRMYYHLNFLLVQGNHDRLSEEQYKQLGIKLMDLEHVIGDLRFTHEINEDNANKGHTVSGHEHPGMILKGKAKQRVKLPCYVVRNERHLILPAFSTFTGLNTRSINEESTCYAFTDRAIVKK